MTLTTDGPVRWRWRVLGVSKVRTGLVGTVLVGAVLMGAVSGCAGVGDTYDASTAASLEQKVLALSESAAASDFPTAQTRLGELEAESDAALARGDISASRHESIESAVALVRADVVAEIAAAEAARVAEEARLAEEARVAEEASAAEQARIAEEQRAAEAERLAEVEQEKDKGNGKNGKGDKSGKD